MSAPDRASRAISSGSAPRSDEQYTGSAFAPTFYDNLAREGSGQIDWSDSLGNF